MALLVRAVDEYRFGLRPIDVEELLALARCWYLINDGATPSAAALRLLGEDAAKDVGSDE